MSDEYWGVSATARLHNRKTLWLQNCRTAELPPSLFFLFPFQIPSKFSIFGIISHTMEEQRSNAGQGLGIAGLVLGIMAIPLGIIPCTFYLGILFGIIGLVLSIVALTQAHRGFGPKGLIIAAMICSVVGFSFAWNGGHIVKEIMREKGFGGDGRFDNPDWSADTTRGFGEDTTTWSDQPSDMKGMTDSLKNLENGKP
jgi:hypothetical protein